MNAGGGLGQLVGDDAGHGVGRGEEAPRHLVGVADDHGDGHGLAQGSPQRQQKAGQDAGPRVARESPEWNALFPLAAAPLELGDLSDLARRQGQGQEQLRGDLALASGTTADRSYDVHMATTGANLACQSCHTTRNHRIAGKGSDLRATDLDVKVECTKCHNAAPHDDSNLNKHTARVACQTCHISVYGRNASDSAATEATETHRDWTKPHTTSSGAIHPTPTLANDLKPEYKFWNGYSYNQNLGDSAAIDPSTGTYATSRPEGAINDAASKLFPFKYKTAYQPIATSLSKLIAVDTGVYFAAGNLDSAVKAGLVNMGLSSGTPYSMITTDTYQLITHQVMTKDRALTCNQCHGTTAQMDLKGKLGYAMKGTQSSTCRQCHGAEDMPSFTSLHNKHVKDKKYDCAWCHTFSRPERGLRAPGN